MEHPSSYKVHKHKYYTSDRLTNTVTFSVVCMGMILLMYIVVLCALLKHSSHWSSNAVISVPSAGFVIVL